MNINARSESIFEKITFRDSFKNRRCIIPINGFYEWKIEDKEKIPYFIRDIKKDYLALAGVWDEWFDKELNMKIVTIALITCNANEKLRKIHHRMPVVLEKNDFATWLKDSKIVDLNKLFKLYPSKNLELYEVSKKVNAVNKTLFDNTICIEKVKKEKLTHTGQLALF